MNKMTENEAIKILIALAVCSDAKLSCDEDCPFYNEEEEKILGKCNVKFEDKVYEAVKVLNKKYEVHSFHASDELKEKIKPVFNKIYNEANEERDDDI